MPLFEIDLPSDGAARFDKLVDRFIVSELICRPDIDVRVSSYSITEGVQHRSVYMSSPRHLAQLRKRWEETPNLKLASPQ